LKQSAAGCQHFREPGSFKRLSLPLNCSWIAAGGAVDTASQWLRVVVLLHLGGETMVGALALAFAVCAPVYALTNLGLRGAVATDARNQYQLADYLALRLVTSLLALLVVGGIVWATQHDFSTALLILLVGAAELFKAVSDVFHALAQQNERMDRFAISLMIRGPLMVAVLALGVYATGSLLGAVAALPLVAAGTLLLYDVPNARRIIEALRSDAARTPGGRIPHASGLAPRWRLPTMLRLARLSMPLGVVITMLALQVSIPRYLISYHLGNHALGVFVSVFYLGMIGSRAAGAIGQSSGPRLARYFAAADIRAYSRLLGKLLALVAAVGIATVLGVALLGGPILALIYKPHFAAYAELAVYLMAAAAVGYLAHPLGIALEAMRRFKTHMAIRAAGIAVLLAAAAVLIPAYGLKGAALAMILSSATAVAGCAYAVAGALSRSNAGRRAELPISAPLSRAA